MPDAATPPVPRRIKSIYITEELIKAVQEAGEREQRPFSRQIEYLVRRGLEAVSAAENAS